MKYLLPIFILLFAFTSYANWYAVDNFSLENSKVEINNAVADCTATLSANSATFDRQGGSVTVNVAIGSGCVWAILPSNNSTFYTWLNHSSGGTGSGIATISVFQSIYPFRSATLTIAGQSFTVNQNTGCAFRFSTVSSSGYFVPVTGATVYVSVRAQDDSCLQDGYMLTPNVPWITFNSERRPVVSFNPGATRVGTITVSPNSGTYQPSTVTVTQSACSYTVTPSRSASTYVPAAGAAIQVSIATEPGCSWSISYMNSLNSWLSPSAASGTGSANITLNVAPNSGVGRSELVKINGTTSEASTGFVIIQETGCAFSPGTQSLTVAGGTGSIAVTGGCTWNAVSNVPWLTITSQTGAGNGTLNYSVTPNTGATRTGSISLFGQVFTITQAGGCTYSLSVSDIYIEPSGGNAGTTLTTQTGCVWNAVSNVSWITVNNASGSGTSAINFSVAANAGTERIGTITIGGKTLAVSQQSGLTTPTPTPTPTVTPTPTPARRTANDYDGDGKADFSIFRAIVGEWWVLKSSDGGNYAAQFGASTDKPVPADYTGDGKTDFAFYRNGEWFILRSEDYSYYAFPFGLPDDIPTPADYDGDGKTDAAVFRPSTNIWYIAKSTGGITVQPYGESGDVPVVADYDGDKKADIALYRPGTSGWYFLRSGDGGETSFQFGNPTDKVIPADYGGDGKANAALYRPSTNEWFVLTATGTIRTQFGTAGDIPVPADYDGDGKTDIAIYRPSTTDWWYAASSAGGQQRARQFGLSADVPLPSIYVR